MLSTRWERLSCLLLLFILLPYSCIKTVAAQGAQSNTKIVKGDANSCELNSLYLDYLAQDARASLERIFVIARLGKGEKSRDLNRTRLVAARFYLIANRELKKEMIIFAEGDRADKEGRLEFYLGSKLYLVSLVERGKDVCLTCCNDDFPKSR